ncbi:MAG: hypothetical protein ACK5PZ_02885, partial [Pirellula sp.]
LGQCIFIPGAYYQKHWILRPEKSRYKRHNRSTRYILWNEHQKSVAGPFLNFFEQQSMSYGFLGT